MVENKPFRDQPAHSSGHTSDGVDVVADGLGKRFNREWIFRKLDFLFASKHAYAVAGPNGSGKSTLLQILWGQLTASEGTIRYTMNNRPIRVEEIASHVAIAAPYMDLIEEFTLREHLAFHFRMRATRDGHSIEDLMELFYLSHAAEKFISNFSSGMKQRLKLGLALYTRAALVFLDEPGTNLDRQAFDWYRTEVDKIRHKCTLFIASNNEEEFPDEAVRVPITDYKGSR